MATDVDPAAILDAHRTTLSNLDDAARFGREVAASIDRIYFVGCGGPNRIMLSVQYWLERHSKTLDVRRFYPAEFLTQGQPRLDARTLVVLGSKSGTTPETLEAARFLRDKPCRTVGFTEGGDRPLARSVQTALLTGKTVGAPATMFMLVAAMCFALLDEKEGRAPFEAVTLARLRPLPVCPAATRNRDGTPCPRNGRGPPTCGHRTPSPT